MSCQNCSTGKAITIIKKNSLKVCKKCFYILFETEIHNTIISLKMFKRGEKVALGMSGGKDSTVLAYVLKKLNEKYDYGLNLVLLCVDEGITGYRDHSLRTVAENSAELGLPLEIFSFKTLFGVTMDEVVKKTNGVHNCTNCGTFRRQAFEIGAIKMGADCIVTGHNADDMAETVLLNLFRGDLNRLQQCTAPRSENCKIPRIKPFRNTFQSEIVFYAFYKKLNYFSTECTYSPGAFRGHMRVFIKELERIEAKSILNLIKAADEIQKNKTVELDNCKCGVVVIKGKELCNACELSLKFKNM